MLRNSDRYRHTRARPAYPHVHVYLSPRANLLLHLPRSAAIRHFFLKLNVRKNLRACDKWSKWERLIVPPRASRKGDSPEQRTRNSDIFHLAYKKATNNPLLLLPVFPRCKDSQAAPAPAAPLLGGAHSRLAPLRLSLQLQH